MAFALVRHAYIHDLLPILNDPIPTDTLKYGTEIAVTDTDDGTTDTDDLTQAVSHQQCSTLVEQIRIEINCMHGSSCCDTMLRTNLRYNTKAMHLQLSECT